METARTVTPVPYDQLGSIPSSFTNTRSKHRSWFYEVYHISDEEVRTLRQILRVWSIDRATAFQAVRRKSYEGLIPFTRSKYWAVLWV